MQKCIPPHFNNIETPIYHTLTKDLISSPDLKGHVRYCHHLSVVVHKLLHFNLLL